MSGVELKAKLAELLSNVYYLRLIAVADRNEHAAALYHLIARADKALVERLFKRFADAEHLAGGFHLRTKMVVDVLKLFK